MLIDLSENRNQIREAKLVKSYESLFLIKHIKFKDSSRLHHVRPAEEKHDLTIYIEKIEYGAGMIKSPNYKISFTWD